MFEMKTQKQVAVTEQIVLLEQTMRYFRMQILWIKKSVSK